MFSYCNIVCVRAFVTLNKKITYLLAKDISHFVILFDSGNIITYPINSNTTIKLKTDTQTGKQTDRQTERQTDRQTTKCKCNLLVL